MYGARDMKLAYALTLVIIVLGIGLLFFDNTYAATYVNSGVVSNTTWTYADSPYVLTGNVVVYSGVTLNIQAGAIVNLNGYQLEVSGLMIAQGSSTNRVSFLGNGNAGSQVTFSATNSAGCLVDYATFYSVPIVVNGGSPKVNNCYLTSAPSAVITVNGGSALITNNVIVSSSQNGIHINQGSTSITSNLITGCHYGIYNVGSNVNIFDNNITNCFSGIYTVGQSSIQQNNILNNQNDGIVTTTSGAAIFKNAIAYNTCGISGNGNINNNTITNNYYGLYGQTGYSRITNNNVFDNDENVHLTENDTNLDATYNWWGTTDASIISPTISDFRVHSNLGNLTFIPFLTQPAFAPSIPSFIPVSTPPPSPIPPTPTSTPTKTGTPIPYVTPISTSYPFQTTFPTPSQTPHQIIKPTDEPKFGGFSSNDIANVVVIMVAVSLVVTIIAVINRRFGQVEKPQVKTKRRPAKLLKQKKIWFNGFYSGFFLLL